MKWLVTHTLLLALLLVLGGSFIILVVTKDATPTIWVTIMGLCWGASFLRKRKNNGSQE